MHRQEAMVEPPPIHTPGTHTVHTHLHTVVHSAVCAAEFSRQLLLVVEQTAEVMHREIFFGQACQIKFMETYFNVFLATEYSLVIIATMVRKH